MAIYINTNQNVKINFEISSIGDRIFAYLIDTFVLAGISIGIYIIGSITDAGIGFFLFFILIFFYHLICELTMNGQSVGKRSQGIRVMKKDGNPATFSGYFLRFLLRPIDSFYGLGLAFAFFTDHSQRLGDLAAGTIIVDVNSEDVLSQQVKDQMNINVHEGIKYPEAAQLSEQDLQIIQTILDSRIESKKHHIVIELATKIADKLGISYDQDWAYYFLLRVVQDYQKIQLGLNQ